jgi:peptidoglycan/xylan/chitin deacetylase (PgdA/CDA1 family)
MFHDFMKDNSVGTQGAVSEENFYKIIDFCNTDKISNPHIIIENTKKNLEKSLFLTFDDGLLSQFDIALQILEERNIKGLFFVHSKPLIGEYDIHQITRNFKNTKHFDTVDEFNSLLIEVLKSTFSDKEKSKIEKDFRESKYLDEYNFYSESDRELRYIRDFKVTLEQYQDSILSLMNEKGINIEDLIEQTYMNKKMLKEVAEKGHVIGLHSHSHPTNLARMTEEEQYFELNTNSEILEEIIGYKPKAISYPSNSYNQFTIEVLKKLKVNYGFRANDQINLDPYELARIDATYIVDKINTE